MWDVKASEQEPTFISMTEEVSEVFLRTRGIFAHTESETRQDKSPLSLHCSHETSVCREWGFFGNPCVHADTLHNFTLTTSTSHFLTLRRRCIGKTIKDSALESVCSV